VELTPQVLGEQRRADDAHDQQEDGGDSDLEQQQPGAQRQAS
jgi:hypothetical protein